MARPQPDHATSPDDGSGGAVEAGGQDVLNLKQVAQVLGVHYMTAYRYVRAGALPARRVGTAWVVDPGDLAAFTTDRVGSVSGAGARSPGRGGEVSGTPRACDAAAPADAPGRAGSRSDGANRVDRVDRLRRSLVVGDESRSWSVVRDALVSGWDAERVLVDLVSEAVARTEEADGPAAGHLAVVTATRLLAVVSSRFRRPGRTRGAVVVGAPSGEGHNFGLAVVADVLRLRNLDVLDLGADVPPAAFVGAVTAAARPVAVGIGLTSVDRIDVVREVVDRVQSVAPGLPILLGGQAVRCQEVAMVSGATEWAADARGAADRVEDLLADRARRGV